MCAENPDRWNLGDMLDRLRDEMEHNERLHRARRAHLHQRQAGPPPERDARLTNEKTNASR